MEKVDTGAPTILLSIETAPVGRVRQYKRIGILENIRRKVGGQIHRFQRESKEKSLLEVMFRLELVRFVGFDSEDRACCRCFAGPSAKPDTNSGNGSSCRYSGIVRLNASAMEKTSFSNFK